MKKVLPTLLTLILVIGVLAGAGFAGYRAGYHQGMRVSDNGNTPPLDRPENHGRDEMPRFNFDRDFDRGFGHGMDRGFPRSPLMMSRSRGFDMFSAFMLLAHLALWALVIGLVYLLFTRSGWLLSLTKQHLQDPPPANIETEVKSQDQDSENV